MIGADNVFAMIFQAQRSLELTGKRAEDGSEVKYTPRGALFHNVEKQGPSAKVDPSRTQRTKGIRQLNKMVEDAEKHNEEYVSELLLPPRVNEDGSPYVEKRLDALDSEKLADGPRRLAKNFELQQKNDAAAARSGRTLLFGSSPFNLTT